MPMRIVRILIDEGEYENENKDTDECDDGCQDD